MIEKLLKYSHYGYATALLAWMTFMVTEDIWSILIGNFIFLLTFAFRITFILTIGSRHD